MMGQNQMELIAGRKTQYNNFHQINIIGSGAGQKQEHESIKLPDIADFRSPPSTTKSPIKDSPMNRHQHPLSEMVGGGHNPQEMVGGVGRRVEEIEVP